MNGKHRTWIYHAEKKAKLVSVTPDELEALQADGWELSPVKQSAKVDDNDAERGVLIERFYDDPEELTKDELVRLGRYLGVKMMKAWPTGTLIDKVRSVLE